MRPGPLEIIVILIVLVAIIILARMFRAKPTPEQKKSASQPNKARRVWRILSRLGVVLIIVGAIFLFAAIGMFRWAFQSYMWAFISVVAGFALVYFSRKK